MDEKPDIDVGALGQGCLAGCGSGCGAFVILLILMAIAGVNLSQVRPGDIPGWITFIGFLLGLGSDLVVGYVTARAAPRSPNLHALIIAIVGMVMGLFGLVGTSQSSTSPRDPSAMLSGIVSWILTIPMTLWGAKLAINQDERDE